MRNVILRRIESSSHGTFGLLTVGELTLHTLELPWKENKSNVSCIPQGGYRVRHQHSPAFRKNLYRLLDVPKRSGILIHAGNFAGDRSLGLRTDLLGCIALGMDRGVLSGQKVVTGSVLAISKFEAALGKKDFNLIIEGVV